MREFHISRAARDRYNFDSALFSFDGNVIFANFHAARVFTQKINDKRDLLNYPESALKPGQVNAMGLVDEILHVVIEQYRQQYSLRVMEQALEFVRSRLGKDRVEVALIKFTQEYPPTAVYQRKSTPEEYLKESDGSVSNLAVTLEELIMLRVSNLNQAMIPYNELIDDERLQQESAYTEIYREVQVFFDSQQKFGPDHQNLIEMLRTPAVEVPYSLFGQLEFIRSRWGGLLGKYLYRLLTSLDFLKEEEARFSGPGPFQIPVFKYGEGEGDAETENFSPDKEWMPHLVLMAKNTYVWLNQLSRKFQQDITRLDQIPDEELAELARRGFTGLWLIGLWERSPASANIKRMCGNPEAISSAYSLSSYSIANDLGGDQAFQDLRQRAWRHGIRLASDMVPNHMGIDSQWVVDHPDWFISLNDSPFPSYSFNGPNLSNDGRVGIYIEDHYFNRTDASVVFKRVDHSNGSTRYVYHGNDGTSMPWNDTAQLNYLNPEVREAVIQTILHVARQFPVIRFDAAMTLAKRHFQRLWYPEPGTGGAIPSRAEYGLNKQQFDAAIPVEFWREVVDRVAREAPDTLLLAEAFWLMEGYFVRTLGMHRVYNSAFMNLLRNEENAQYRTVMKNTLEFDTEILKRYVNFMNNPDERTAVDQFGKGDKYFGICVLMSTLPGLPMFGHGQVEGLTEKYGMEYKRAYWDETPDQDLVERHQREIFPVLHHRYLFSGVENFLLYDFFTPEGRVNEDVFAYSNGQGSERGLVVYHNKFADTRGWIKTSVGFVVKEGDQRRMVQKSLGEGLAINQGANHYTIFRDHAANLEYIRPSAELKEKGLYLELSAYKYHVFMDFRQVEDDAWQSYQRLCAFLGGRGVPNIEEAMHELLLQAVLIPFKQVANPGYFKHILAWQATHTRLPIPEQYVAEALDKFGNLLEGIKYITGEGSGSDAVKKIFAADFHSTLELPYNLEGLFAPIKNQIPPDVAAFFKIFENDSSNTLWLILSSWVYTRSLGKLQDPQENGNLSLSWFDEWQFGRILVQAYQGMGKDEPHAWWMVKYLRVMILEQEWFREHSGKPLNVVMEKWLGNSEIQTLIGINRYKDVLWFNHESYIQFIHQMAVIAVIDVLNIQHAEPVKMKAEILAVQTLVQHLLDAEKNCGFRVDELLENLKKLAD